MKPFHERRRQQFLGEEMYEKTRVNQRALIDQRIKNLQEYLPGTEAHSVTYEMLYLEAMWTWQLDYTAGVPIHDLAPRIAGIVDAFEKWNEVDDLWATAIRARHPENGPHEYRAAPEFDTIADYEDTLQLLSIALLLRDQRSVERIIHILRSHRGEDGLFEQLIGAYVDDEQVLEECVLGEPFETLLKAFYADTDDQSLDYVEAYLKKWYPAMADHPRWYNGHLHISPEGYSAYYGYWSFEAAATVYLLDLNDSLIDHMVYPKDLVAYGKALREQGRTTSNGSDSATETGRIEGGKACPRIGYWFTPAQIDSRRHFQQGEIMPVFEASSYGHTIWQWSNDQKSN